MDTSGSLGDSWPAIGSNSSTREAMAAGAARSDPPGDVVSAAAAGGSPPEWFSTRAAPGSSTYIYCLGYGKIAQRNSGDTRCSGR